MELLILDNTFKSIYTLDDFQSLIWTEKYIGAGDFELYTPINPRMVEITSFIRSQREKEIDTFFWIKESEQVMIPERIEISTDTEYGNKILFTGHSLEAILARRIIWKQTVLSGSFQNGIKKLMNENIINPSIQDRKIPNMIFVDSTDPFILEQKLERQFTGDNLYDAIYEVCEPLKIGFRVRLNDRNQFVFELYYGKDRSYDQLVNPYVIFSPKFENLVKSNFLEDVQTLRTITLIAGEDEGHDRRTTTVGYGSGLQRREMFTDARDIQSETYDEEGETHKVPDDQYFAQLRQRGTEDLSEYKFTKEFEGEVETNQMFVYGEDFYKGDLVQVETEYGVKSKMRIIQMVRSQDESGMMAYPIFEIVT